MNQNELVRSDRIEKEIQQFEFEKEQRRKEWYQHWIKLNSFDKIKYGSFTNYFFEMDTPEKIKTLLTRLKNHL